MTVRTRHSVGGVRIRDTHSSMPELWTPEVSGVPFSIARDGEEIQEHDLAPNIVATRHIMSEALTRDLFAATLRPPIVVGSLPALPDDEYPDGSFVFLTTDKLLYRNDAGSWVHDSDATDAWVAGTVQAAAIGVDELAANSIQTQHFQATAAAPQVDNSDSSVVIDPDGITIRNGKIVLEDSSGESVLTADGFSGPWVQFIASGLYNSQFRYGDPGSIPLAGEIPYWSFEGRSHPEVSLELKASDLASAGRYFEFTAGLATSEYVWGRIAQTTVPVSAGRSLMVRIAWSAINATALKPADVMAGVTFYDALGVEISTAAETSSDFAANEVLGEWRWTHHGLAVPDTAAYATVMIHARWPDGSELDSGVRINEVACGVDNREFDTMYFGDVQLNRVTDGLLYVQDPAQAYTFLGVKIRPATGSHGLFEIHRSDETWSGLVLRVDPTGLPSISWGGGDDVADVTLYRSAVGELTVDGKLGLASGLLARFVPLDAVITSPNFASTTVDIGTTTLELTALPSSGVVAVAVNALFRTGQANVGNFPVYGYQSDRVSGQNSWSVIAYGMNNTNQYSSSGGVVSTGGANNRCIRYSVSVGSGTSFYAIRISGYWTTE